MERGKDHPVYVTHALWSWNDDVHFTGEGCRDWAPQAQQAALQRGCDGRWLRCESWLGHF